MTERKYMIVPSEVEIESLYEFITQNIPFDKVVELYKLLKYKMENLEDVPKYSVGVLDTTPKIQLY